MPSATVRAFGKQTQSYSGLNTQNTPLAVKLDASGYREATLLFRIHMGSAMTTGGNPVTVYVSVFREAPTTEDPADFVEGNPYATPPTDFIGQLAITSIQFSTAVPGGILLPLELTGTHTTGSTLRIYLQYVGGAVGSNAMMIISGDLVLKS